MIDPVSLTGTVIVAKHAAESIISGNDPSLAALSALAFPAVNPSISKAAQTGEYIAARKDLGELASSTANSKDHVFMEKVVDAKYLDHGNLEDAWAQLKAGDLTFDSFVLAMVDIVDALTLGVFKPQLLEVKINPHLKAREVVYRAEVSYDNPEQIIQETTENGVKKQETVNTQRRITQVSKISFEISPEAFEKADLTFAESVAKIKDANIADRTVVYSRLDTLTEKDLRIFSENGLKEIDIHSQRLQSVETQEDLLGSGKRNISELASSGGKIVDDRENISSQIKIEDTPPAALPTEQQVADTGIHVYGEPQISAEQKKLTIAQQQEKLDHLAGTREIKSAVTEQIGMIQKAESPSQNQAWARETLRVRESAGEYDIFSLKDVSIDEFVQSGAELISDKARVKDTIVAVDISQTGETVNFVDSETKKSWLIRESDIRRNRATSSETQTWRIGKQIAEYDYLANSKEILSATIQHKDITTTTVKDIVETKTHWKLFGWNASGFLGENVKTEVTPTVSTHTYVDTVELAPGQNIFANFNASKETLLAQGGKLTDHASNINTEKLATTTSRSFEEGTISYIPFVGGIGHLVSKAGLGGEVTLSDAFWAVADVAEIATTAIAIAAALPSGGASVGAQVAATSAKTAAKVAAKTAAKAATKAVAKTATKAVAKTAVKTGGKAVIKGTIQIAGKNTTKLATKTSAKALAKQSINKAGKIALKNGGRAGAKATVAKAGSVVRYKHLPNNGTWTGLKGNSNWIPPLNEIPKNNNPLNKTWRQILKENGLSKGIPFNHGKIDLHAASKGTVRIKDFGIDRAKNFAQADSKFSRVIRSGTADSDIQSALKKMGIDPSAVTKGDIKSIRKQGFTWHERPDMKTLDLISSELHANVPHSGGISAMKEQLTAANITTGVLK